MRFRLRHRWIAGPVLAALWAVVAGLSPGSAQATFSGPNGRIAWGHEPFGNGALGLFTANPDGSAVRLGPAGAGPDWSPDGSRIAYDWSVDGGITVDVFTADPDGGNVIRVTHGDGANARPAWSPDGSRMALDREPADDHARFGIYTMRADGSDLRRVTTVPPELFYDEDPQYSPDGTQIVFIRTRTFTRQALFVVNVDGTGLHQLTAFRSLSRRPDWSPDGSLIVFRANAPTTTGAVVGNVYTIHPDGTGLRDLTTDPSFQRDFNPCWSPDGTRIVFQHLLTARGGENDLYTMNPDGSDVRFLLHRHGNDQRPDWGTAPPFAAAPAVVAAD